MKCIIKYILHSFGHAFECIYVSVYTGIGLWFHYDELILCEMQQTTTLFAQKNEKPQRIEMMIVLLCRERILLYFLRLLHFYTSQPHSLSIFLTLALSCRLANFNN